MERHVPRTIITDRRLPRKCKPAPGIAPVTLVHRCTGRIADVITVNRASYGLELQDFDPSQDHAQSGARPCDRPVAPLRRRSGRPVAVGVEHRQRHIPLGCTAHLAAGTPAERRIGVSGPASGGARRRSGAISCGGPRSEGPVRHLPDRVPCCCARRHGAQCSRARSFAR